MCFRKKKVIDNEKWVVTTTWNARDDALSKISH